MHPNFIFTRTKGYGRTHHTHTYSCSLENVHKRWFLLSVRTVAQHHKTKHEQLWPEDGRRITQTIKNRGRVLSFLYLPSRGTRLSTTIICFRPRFSCTFSPTGSSSVFSSPFFPVFLSTLFFPPEILSKLSSCKLASLLQQPPMVSLILSRWVERWRGETVFW